MNNHSTPGIDTPALEWRSDEGPRSGRFDDIYFSTTDGLAESHHVFLGGIGVPQIWTGRERFSIGEIGFGSGLNFLATWAEWETSAVPGAVLSYVAVEGYPLSVDEISRALRPFLKLESFARQLVSAYPDPHPGFHHIQLAEGRVRLVLLLGPVEDMLAFCTGQMNAWYLDGFAPGKNPDMWSENVLKAIANLSVPGTRLATFTAAGQVRRDLESVGFKMTKVPGFGKKRECLSGVFKGNEPASKLAPWYQMPSPLKPGARVAVIGAGIAGAALANALKSITADVTVYDRRSAPAEGASGNPVGLLQPRPADPRQPYARFQTEAYLHTIRILDRLADTHSVWKGPRGIVSFARDDAFLERYMTWLREGALPDNHARIVQSKDMGDVCGINIQQAGVFFPKAGTIDPAVVCHALLGGTRCRFDSKIATLRNADGVWQLLSDKGLVLGEADAVVLANGVEARELSPDADLALHAKRGQISFVEPSEQSHQLKVGISYGGYATPVTGPDGTHVLGATYERCPDWNASSWRDLKDQDHQQNLDLLSSRSTELAALFGNRITGGRASLRTTTADHAPVVGPLFSDTEYKAAYGDLHHGKPQNRYPSAMDLIGFPGLYVLNAFGSRGFALATLTAEILVAEMFGLPVPAEKAVIEAIHPARFLVRSLKRR